MNTADREAVAIAFGMALKEARQVTDFSQEVLGERAGLDRTYPGLLELGLRSPSLAVVIQLARALRISPTSLVGQTMVYLKESSHASSP